MDWRVCVICQKETSECLKCPLNAVGRDDNSQPYENFLQSVKEFRKMNCLPVTLYFDEATSVDDLITNKASWHKSCYGKFSKCRLERLQKKRDLKEAGSSQESVRGKRQRIHSTQSNECIFCSTNDSDLHKFMTLDADNNIRKMAIDLQDTAVLTKIASGDVVASGSMYHLKCITEFRNRHRSLMRKLATSTDSGTVEQKRIEAWAFVELIHFIENSVAEKLFYFKIFELRNMYENRLVELGVKKEVNKVRFKEKIHDYFPEAQLLNDGKHTMLIFEQGIKQMLKNTLTDYEADAVILAKAANIIRPDIFRSNEFHFNATFPPNCQENSVPTTLKMLVSMLLYGPGVNSQNSLETQETLTISQTIIFNCKKTPTKCVVQRRHSMSLESPLPLYIGLNVHTLTRSKKLITQLHQKGLSVSYDRILQLESQLENAVCERAHKEGVVCPSQLRHGLFTFGAIDNIDHNPSSATAKGSFHGTGISIFQQPLPSNPGQKREAISLSGDVEKKKLCLPDIYTIVPAVALKESTVELPKINATKETVVRNVVEAIKQEELWIKSSLQLIEKEKLEKGDSLSWSAYHASQQRKPSSIVEPGISQLLPLFYEKAATPAMIKHGMDVVRNTTHFLNPIQIPVIAMDAPLFALAKYIQWKWPNTHGEDKYVVMLGGFHIELAVWKTIGDYLKGSGWTNALTQSGLASSGTADSFLTCSHCSRTRHAHQVSAIVLKQLQRDAYLSSHSSDTTETEEEWRERMVKISPTFQYWDTIYNLEILGLLLVRAHREADFALYVESLKALVPWFFALDHYNYARWIPIHIRDMDNLPQSILKEFMNGLWVVHKTTNHFSAIPIDQAHEQNNKLVKGSGGAVGLTENPSAFRKWMVAGPEQARLLTEFENISGMGKENSNHFHHEEILSTQKHFKQQVRNLTQTIKAMGNPFLNATEELLTLDSLDVMDQSVVHTVRTIEDVGKQQYKEYYKEVLINCKKSVHEPIKKNSLRLFKSPAPKYRDKQADKIASLKTDVNLFSKLYIVAQHRECDMNIFFSHENHPYPPSLSDNGKLRFGKKSDLLTCLLNTTKKEAQDVLDATEFLANVDEVDEEEPLAESILLEATPNLGSSKETDNAPSNFDVIVFDGAVVVHLLQPTAGIRTFEDYANEVFIPYIGRHLSSSKRVDIVWDTYVNDSIKSSIREKRGNGQRRKVLSQNKIPANWLNFLCNDDNKQELYTFLAKKIESSDFPSDKEVITTYGDGILVRNSNVVMPTCNHQEADTRLVFHLQDALKQGSLSCLVRTVDTDVIVILIGKFYQIQKLHPKADIWVAFGTGKNFSYIHVNVIAQSLRKENCTALPMFHSFTGCDTVSSFFGKGKKAGWMAWKSYPEVTAAFNNFTTKPFSPVDIHSESFKILERFTIIMYQRSSWIESVNEARREMFCQQNKAMEYIPPTQSALLEHTKRAVYQASIWSTCDLPQHLNTPEEWGWKTDKESKCWTPLWTELPIAAEACGVLVKCGCKTDCKGNKCTCKKSMWKCTNLCKCNCIRSQS